MEDGALAEPLRFTGHERDDLGTGVVDDLDYMHARFYSPHLGRFLSVDPGKDWQLSTPQSWNLFTYVRNNPVNSTDPTGRCIDPGGSGKRICIETFIPAKTFGGFKGDDRGPRSDGGSFRTRQFVNVSSDEPRALISERFEEGVSQFGRLRREAEVDDHEVMPTAEGLVISAAASDGLLYGLAPNLEYNLRIVGDDAGELTVTGSHTEFPSLEVWVYEDGKDPVLIYVYEATADGFVEGFIDINQTMTVPE